MINKRILTLFVLSVPFLSACGGGSGDSSTTPVASVPAPTWNQGVFASESNFKNRCENPRTGSDINGDAYPDIAGSKLYEKHWLRSWSNNTYLWYDEIIDSDPASIDDPIDYFDQLVTTAETPSGTPRDQFHFAQDTTEYLQLTSGGAALSYGARFKLIKASPPREGRIAYVEPNSPAADANFTRGTEIIAIDGVDFINGGDTDTLNKGLFPDVAGEEHTFIVRDLGQTTTRSVVLKAEVVTNEPVKATRIINTPSGKVGYLALNTFGTRNTEIALAEAMEELAEESPDDLVLDLRYNGGGLVAISAQLGYMIAGSALSDDKVFTKTVFNAKHPTNDPRTGNTLIPVPFIDTTLGLVTGTAIQPLPSLNLNRVFVLSSGSTCSASELLINALRGIDVDVVLIGDTTCGKPYGFSPTDNCGTTYSTIQFRSENEKGFGDYADGFSPNSAPAFIGESVQGCQVTEDVMHPLGDEQEVMLKAALEYRNTSTCPPVTASRAETIDVEGNLKNDPYFKKRQLLEQIRMDYLRTTYK